MGHAMPKHDSIIGHSSGCDFRDTRVTEASCGIPRTSSMEKLLNRYAKRVAPGMASKHTPSSADTSPPRVDVDRTKASQR